MNSDMYPIFYHHVLNVLTQQIADYFFGVGENMLNTYLISCDHVECLFLPRTEFKRAGQLHRLNAIKEQLDEIIPTSQRLFDIYFSGKFEFVH